MLKWTVSRSLSTASSTPRHGPGGGGVVGTAKTTAARRPFRDLSNTPPATSGSSRIRSSSRAQENDNVVSSGGAHDDDQSSARSMKRTPSRKRRCRSQGSDLRGYFQATKPSLGSSKRQSTSHRNSDLPIVEGFYQSTPRVDNDIGPLFPSPERRRLRGTSNLTLPVEPRIFKDCTSSGELPQNLMNEARANHLQSHVSDFFQQISMATSPEDVMESESLPFISRRYVNRQASADSKQQQTPVLPKLARITKLNARNKTPYHTKVYNEVEVKERGTGAKRETAVAEVRQTPLAGKLLSLKLDHDRPMYENMDNTITEVLNREQEANYGCKSVAEILLEDSEERRKILETKPIPRRDSKRSSPRRASPAVQAELEEHVYESIPERKLSPEPEDMDVDEAQVPHNDSSVSSASQLLENPSPISWAFCSPSSDLDGEFTLKRQRAIRRKRKNNGDGSNCKRPRREPLPLVEAVNRHVKRFALETDLDSSVSESRHENGEKTEPDERDKEEPELKLVEERKELEEQATGASSRLGSSTLKNDADDDNDDKTMSPEAPDQLPDSFLVNRKPKELTAATSILSNEHWDTDSPKSSLLDSFATTTTTSAACTPETPLVATVRRCLKYSPETPSGSALTDTPRGRYRGAIEIECSVREDQVLVKIIRCRDLRRRLHPQDGPVHAYVKASLKDPVSGEGCVKRTAVHRATPHPVFQETLHLPIPASCCPGNNNKDSKQRLLAVDIAVWHRDRRARRSELLGCMTLPLPLAQDKEAAWHPLEAGSGRNASSMPAYATQQDSLGGRSSVVSPPLSKDGDSVDNNNSSTAGADDLAYLRHLELEPVDPLTGLPLHPGFTARGGRTPCTVTRRLVRPAAQVTQVSWGFSLSWGRPPRVERVDPGSPAERSGLRPGDYVVFVEAANVVTLARDDILALIQTATTQLTLEVYRRGVHGHAQVASNAASLASRRRSSVAPAAVGVLAAPGHYHNAAVAFTTEAFPNLAADAPPEEELNLRETRYWQCLKSGQVRFTAPLAEHMDVISASDHLILFQNLDELLNISEEIREEGGGIESYLPRVPRITAAYRRYLSGLQRACCLLVALRKNSAFAKVVCEPAVPRRRKPDLTGVLVKPLEHYREMTRLLCQACPRNCVAVRDLAQGYREATANAGVMEPARDTGKPLLSLQEVESRLVFARCQPFALAVPGRQWLFGGALAKVEGRGRVQATWALLLTDLLVFARVSRDRVLFVTEEPLRLACIAEACFTVRKRPTEFRLQVTTQPNVPGENPNASTELVQCTGTGGGGAGGCSPHSRPRRRLLILRAPSPELKAVWHNLLQRQIIYVNTGYGSAAGAVPGLESPDDEDDSPDPAINYLPRHNGSSQREATNDSEAQRRSAQQVLDEECVRQRPSDSLDLMLKSSSRQQEDNHLAQWVQNSHQIPPPDQEVLLEEWTAEELAARTPRGESAGRDFSEATEESTVVNSDAEQQSSASSASLSTVKSNSQPPNKSGSAPSSKEASSSSINICRRCHRSGCPTPPPIRDPFSPLPPRIAVVPATPEYCSRHRALRNGIHDSPSRGFSTETNTEDGSEEDLDCDGEPPYRALRRFGTLSSLDQDDELDEQTVTTVATASQAGEEELGLESPPSGLRAWTLRASSYVVSKMSILEHFGEGCLLQPPAPPERNESSLEPGCGSNGDEEGTASGGTSGDDIWGTPTSGGPDDESFAGSPCAH